jgi:hypothetical protein
MALSMDEQRVLAEIEHRLADDDPVLAARLTTFRLPRLALAPRSARSRLTASLLMLAVVGVVSVFVYTLMPLRGQGVTDPARPSASSAAPTMSAQGDGKSPVSTAPASALRRGRGGQS